MKCTCGKEMKLKEDTVWVCPDNNNIKHRIYCHVDMGAEPSKSVTALQDKQGNLITWWPSELDKKINNEINKFDSDCANKKFKSAVALRQAEKDRNNRIIEIVKENSNV